jgi:hypothetical protein
MKIMAGGYTIFRGRETEMLRWILLTGLIWSSFARADACREVDYSAELGPARHQAETGWCYAHTAADLVTQHLKTRVSATDLAAAYLLADLSAAGGSPEFKARTKRWRMEDPGAYAPARIFGDLGLYSLGGYDQDAIFLAGSRGFCADENLPGGPAEFKHHMQIAKRIWRDRAWREECLRESKREIRRIGSMPNPVAQDMARVFQCYVDRSCGRRIRPARPVVAGTLDIAADVEHFERGVQSGKIDVKQVQDRLFKKIDALLDGGKIVSIGWDASDAYASDAKGADHASTIVARKMVNGECRYRLRDNYGGECYELNKKFGGRCDPRNGGIWFAKGQIPSMYGLVWIR